MNDFKTEMLVELLDCGYADLSVLEDCKYDFCDVIDECKEMDAPITLNNLAYCMFYIGLRDLNLKIGERKNELDGKAEGGELTDDEKEELEAIEDLDAYEDTCSFHNYLDTNIWFEKNGEIYERYFEEALDEFAENTGYSINK